ncbi:hypothetical protein DNTS_025180, partial [Danionella cerebrum]
MFLIFFTLFLFITHAVRANFLIVFLQSCHIFSGLRELSFLHPFPHIPVHKGSLGVHQVELVVQTSPGLCDGCSVTQHAHGPLDFGQISTRNHRWRLIVDAHFEPSGAPINKLNGTFGLNGSNGGVHVFGHHVPTVQKTAGHVFSMTRITLHHLIGRLKAGIGNVGHGELLVVSLLSRDHRSVCSQGEVNTRIGHQVGLELGEIHIQRSIESQRGRDGGHDLPDEPVEVGVDVVDGFVIDHEGTIGVLQGGVGGQDGVIGLDHRCGHLRSRIDGKLKLGLLAVVDGETLHQQRGEARACTSTKAVEDEKSLEASALVSLWDFNGFQINKNGSWNMFSCPCLTEESVEGIISSSNCLIAGHLSIRLDPVLQ